MTHPEAVEAVAKAIRDFRHIPDAGDGYPAIRMGGDTDLARVAVDTLVAAGWAPRREAADRWRIWMRDQELWQTPTHWSWRGQCATNKATSHFCAGQHADGERCQCACGAMDREIGAKP